jgi:hypothetical protein
LDLQFALRLCSQYDRLYACVVIYGALGLYEDAVDMALKVIVWMRIGSCQHNDLELATINADKPEDDQELRKRLWLKVARHLIRFKPDDIKSCVLFKIQIHIHCIRSLTYLKRCELLKIEDVLPFFPDFVYIDDFKDEICAALDEYKIQIEDLTREMDHATKSAEAIRVDIRQLKKRFVQVSTNVKCHLCASPLLVRSFYAFPCRVHLMSHLVDAQHCFHGDCLLAHMMKDFLSSRMQRRVVQLQEQLAKEHDDEQQRARASSTRSGITALLEQWPSLRMSETASLSETPEPMVSKKSAQDELDEILGCVIPTLI